MGAAIRFPVAAFGAVALAGAMFWFLHSSISGPAAITDLRPTPWPVFTPQIEDTVVEEKRERPERPKDLRLPTLPPVGFTQETNTPVQRGVRSEPNWQPRGPDIGVSGADRAVIPLVRIEPEFPRRAAARGIEGWVQVEFGIMPAGTVANARVVDAHPAGVFEDAALKAIARWKYTPAIVDGAPVARHGVQVVLRFELDGS